jgi:hypothetical protein
MKFLKVLIFTCSLAVVTQANLIEHHKGAKSIALSSDGTTIISRSRTEIKFWDISKQALRSTLSLANSDPYGVIAFSDDGRRLLRRQENTRQGRSYGFLWILWRERDSQWQAGSIVARATLTGKWPLATRFISQDLLVLWPERMERFGSSGKLQMRLSFKFKAQNFAQNAGRVYGAISHDGKSALLNQGKFAALFSTNNGYQIQKLAMERDYGIYNWFFAPDGNSVLGWNQYQADGDERSPMESDEFHWDTQTGKMMCHLPDDNPTPMRFWSPEARAFLEVNNLSPDFSHEPMFQARDVCNHTRLFTFPRFWPSESTISQFIISPDGKSLFALDKTGNIWTRTSK